MKKELKKLLLKLKKNQPKKRNKLNKMIKRNPKNNEQYEI
jgi:hypothetical protein